MGPPGKRDRQANVAIEIWYSSRSSLRQPDSAVKVEQQRGEFWRPPCRVARCVGILLCSTWPGVPPRGGNGGEPPGSGGACGNWEAFPAQAVNALLCAAQCTLPAGPVFVIAAAVSGALPAGARQKPLCPTMAAAVRRCPPRAFERRKRSSGCARLTGW